MGSWVPVVAGGSSLIVGGAFAYLKLRPFFPVKVNCWFCNTDSKVPYRSKNCFVCPNCRQYNGFNEDGDYNCDMPSQYCEALNSPPTRRKAQQPTASTTPGLSLGNGLCQTCNLYQAMKVKALADFVPSQPDKFDEEVQVYERRLERLYGGLCPLCSKTLSCTLVEQDTWLKPKLLNWRMQQSSTLLKALLSPIETGLSRRAMCVTLLLRTLCLSLTLSILCFVLGSSFYDVFSSQTLASSTNDSSVKIAANYSQTTHFLKEWVERLSPGGGWREAVLGHEAGAVLLLLALQLAAVACAGKHHLMSCDAVACLSLVLALAVTSWQQSELLLRLLSRHQLLAVKVGVHVVALVAVALGLHRPRANRVHLNQRSPRGRRSRDGMHNSQLTEDSLNASSDILGNSFPASPLVVSSAQSAAVSNSCPTASLPLSPTPLIARKVSTENTFCPTSSSSTKLNPFLVSPQKRESNSIFSSNTNVRNKEMNPSQQKLSLRPSSLGETLNTSLEGLSLGAEKSYPNSRNSLSRSNIIGGSSNQNGMVLRSQQAMFTQNTSGIAQASWVAGGYWGSPSKNKRLPATQPSPPTGPVIVNNGDAISPSRPSSQSSGFVSHGSGSHSSADGAALNRNILARNVETDRSSVASEPAFMWNFEACETSSQGSQNTEYRSLASSNATVRRRATPFMPGYPASDCQSLLTGTTAPSSLLSSASGVMAPYQDWRTRSPMEDMQNMRALSRLSQHDISDDNLSLMSNRLVNPVMCGAHNAGGSSLRNPWVAFILGMSIMANLVLVVVLHKNGTFDALIR